MHFDGTITLGNVVQTGIVLIGIIAAYFKLRERLAVIETKLAPLWGDYERRHYIRRGQDRESAS